MRIYLNSEEVKPALAQLRWSIALVALIMALGRGPLADFFWPMLLCVGVLLVEAAAHLAIAAVRMKIRIRKARKAAASRDAAADQPMTDAELQDLVRNLIDALRNSDRNVVLTFPKPTNEVRI
jgi:hypothetical protein